MSALLRLSSAIDAVTAFIGRSVSWLILVAVLVSAGNAIIRKAFDTSSNAWLELQWYLYGAVFLLAAAYTLRYSVRVGHSATLGRKATNTRPQTSAWSRNIDSRR